MPAYAIAASGDYLYVVGQQASKTLAILRFASTPPAPGDMNCDGAVNGQDIDGFVLALFGTPPDYAEYRARFPSCNPFLSDTNCDSLVNGQDIDGFVNCLFQGH